MTDYCTIEQVTGAGRLNITGHDYDANIVDMITTASRWIDRYCNIVDNGFAQSNTATRYYDSKRIRSATLHLDMPLLSIVTLTNGDAIAINSSYYRLLPRNGRYYTEVTLLSTHSGWSFSTNDSEVSILGAWGMFTVAPAPITEAALILSAWMLKRYQAALTDVSANFEIGQMQYSEAMPKQVKALLDPYRYGNYVGL